MLKQVSNFNYLNINSCTIHIQKTDEQVDVLDNLNTEIKDEGRLNSSVSQNQFLSKKNKKKRRLIGNDQNDDDQKIHNNKGQASDLKKIIYQLDERNMYLNNSMQDKQIKYELGTMMNHKQSFDSSLFHNRKSSIENDLNRTNDQILLQSFYPPTSRLNTKVHNTRINTPRSEAEIFRQRRIDLDDFNLTKDLTESIDSSILNKQQNSSRLEYILERGYSSTDKEQNQPEKKDEFQVNLKRLNELLVVDEEEIIQQNEEDQKKQQQKQTEEFGDNIFKLSKILEHQNDIIEKISSQRPSQEKIQSLLDLDNQQKVNDSIDKVTSFNESLKRRKQKRLKGSNGGLQYEKQNHFPQQISKIEEILNEEGTTMQIQEHIKQMKEKRVFPSRISAIEDILQNQKTFNITTDEDHIEKQGQNQNQDKGYQGVLTRLDSLLEKNNGYYNNNHDQSISQDQVLNTSLALDVNQSRVKNKFIRIQEKEASQFCITKIDLEATQNNASVIQLDEQYDLHKQNSSNAKNYYEQINKLQVAEPPELEKNINSKKSFYHIFFMDSEQNTKLFRDGFSFKSFLPLTSIQFRPPITNENIQIGKSKKSNQKSNSMSPQSSIGQFIFYLLLKIIYKYMNIILLFGYLIMILLNDSHSQIGTQVLTILLYFLVQLFLEYFVKQRINFQLQIDEQECFKFNYKSNEFIKVKRGSLCQGDIVKVYKNNRFPADLLTICTHSSRNTYIVQDFQQSKTKIVPYEFKANLESCDSINFQSFQGQIKDMPSTLYTGQSKSWKAVVKIDNLNLFYVSEDHIVSRNSILKSEEFVYGIVVLTGIYSTNNGITYEKEMFNSPFFRYYDIIIQIIKFILLLVVILFRLGLFEVALGTAYTTYFFEKYMLKILVNYILVFVLRLKVIHFKGIILAFFPLSLFVALSIADLIQKKLIQKCEIIKISEKNNSNSNKIPDDNSSNQSSYQEKQQRDNEYIIQQIDKNSIQKKKQGIQILDAQKIEHLGDIQVTVSELDGILVKSIDCSAIAFENIVIQAENIREIIKNSEEEENDKLKQKLVDILQVGILSCNQIQRNKLDQAFVRAFESNYLNFEDQPEDMGSIKSTVIGKESSFKQYKLLFQHYLNDIQVNIFESSNGSYRIFVRGLATSIIDKLMHCDELTYIQNLIQSPQFSQLQCFIVASRSIDQHELVQINSAFSANLDEVDEILSKFTKSLTFKFMIAFDYQFEESLKYLQKSGIRNWYLTSQPKINSKFFDSDIPTYQLFSSTKEELVQNINKTFDDLVNFMTIGYYDQDISIMGPSYVSVYLNNYQLENNFYPDIINYSDFIIEDIKDLELLVLCYGRQHLNKTAFIARQIIERNLIYVFIEIIYRFYAGFATQSFFCYKYYLLLEIFFSFGNSIYVMLNFDLSIQEQHRYPICYLQSQFAEYSSFKEIMKSFLRSLYQAISIIFIITQVIQKQIHFKSIMKEPIDSSGKIYSHQLISLTAFISFYNYQKIKTLIHSAQLSYSLILLAVDYLIFIGFLFAFSSQYISDSLGTNTVGEMHNFGQSFIAISLSINVPIICSIPDIISVAYQAILSNSPISQLALNKIQKQIKNKEQKKKAKIAIEPTNIQKLRYKNIDKNKKIVFVSNKKQPEDIISKKK